MTSSKSDSDSGKYVCADCIDDHVVKEEIEREGKRRRCSYCKKRGHAVAIEWIADWVDEVYSAFVGQAEHTPYFPNNSDRVEYRQNGSTPTEIVTEMLECDVDNIASDVVSELSSRHSYRAMKDGETDIYEDGNDVFEIAIPRSSEIKETWQSFCQLIKHDRRFFNETAAKLLREIIDPIVHPQSRGAQSAVRVIEPGTEEGFIYRGRMANTVRERNIVLSNRIKELGASPRELNASGRMNSAGIPVFYGSFDVATCVAELRGPVGGTAIVGKFEILRPLRVLDLTLLKNAMFNISYFDGDVVRKFAYNRFLRGFHKEIKKPVIPGSETLDYLPTQFVAEYLWTRVDPPLDGLIYGSAQISEAGARNIALFPHAARAEEQLEASTAKKQKQSEEEQVAEEGVSFSAIFENALMDVSDFGAASVITKPVIALPSLRLSAESTRVVEVQSIQYTLRESSVDMYEMEARYVDLDDSELDEEDD